MFEKKLIALLASLLLPYCATTTSTPSEEQTPAERANATASSIAVAAPSGKPPLRIPLLAIEVEITADGVKPIGARIVFAPPKTNSAFADLRVQVGGVDGWTYTMTDPRLVEVNDPNERRTIVLESARAFVFVPLLAAATALSVEPLAGMDMDKDVSRGGKFDVRALAVEVCSRTQSELPVCREILAR
jgi:hypothetical protein